MVNCIKSFGICLHVNCLVALRSKHFQLIVRFFEVGNIGPGLRLLTFHKMSPSVLSAIICNIITDSIIRSVKENNKMTQL